MSFLNNLNLKQRIVAALVFFGLAPMIFLGFIAVNLASESLTDAASRQLRTVKFDKKIAVESYFKSAVNQIENLAEHPQVLESAVAFTDSFFNYQLPNSEGDITQVKNNLAQYYTQEFTPTYQQNNQKQIDVKPMLALSDLAIALQYQYIWKNPHPLGSKNNLHNLLDGSDYAAVHAQHHAVFNNVLNRFGYYDIFIVEPVKGHIVYSVFKELDFATSLLTGPYKNTNFAGTFRKVLLEKRTVVTDYQSYLPSYHAPASFVGTPILNKGQLTAVLIFQLPYDPVQAIMGSRTGLGETGDVYLFGADALPRSDSSLNIESRSLVYAFKHPEKAQLTGLAHQKAINGEVGYVLDSGVKGQQVLSSYDKLDLPDLTWFIVAQMDTSEAFSAVDSLVYTSVFIAIAVLVIIVLFGLLIANNIAKPIQQLSKLIIEIAQTGRLTIRSQYQSRNEVGEIASSLNSLLTSLQASFQSVSQTLAATSQGHAGQRAHTQAKGDLLDLCNQVNQAVEIIEDSSTQADKAKQAAQMQAQQAQQAAEDAKQAQQTALLAQQQAEEARLLALRDKTALDKCQANVMMADNNLNIVYLNESVKNMLAKNEAKIRQSIASFKVEGLIGRSIDSFHKTPSHQRSLLKNLADVYKTQIKVSDLTFNLIATPVFSEDKERLGTVVEWEDVTEQLAKAEQELKVANENARVRQALDNVSTNTMIADEHNSIIYMNAAIKQMMQNAEGEIRKVLPQFNASALMGQNMDTFHKNPRHQQGLIDSLTTTYATQITVGTKVFKLTANPIVAANKQRIGTVVEWDDRTDEVNAEREVAALVKAAVAGDLSGRIDEKGKQGFFLMLAQGLNCLNGSCEAIIQQTVSILDAMSHGDLTKRIDGDFSGSFAKLKQDANQTSEKLTEIIARIRQAADTVATGADEIARGNADLSQRTEEQASSLEETAASMEQMTSTVTQNAENASVADNLATEAKSKAVEGQRVVENAVASMAQINDASKKIADIIGVIDEIAFQTNLLALNAAVEAARAGEQGRGFAVVAGEVRSLAQRSAEAAREIKGLIQDSVAKVEDGSVLVNQSGATLQQIMAAVEKVNRMVADISVASSEQSTGIQQVNKTITQMDEMTQQNAALVEQASAAGETMSQTASSMRDLLAFFNIGSGKIQSAAPLRLQQNKPTTGRKAPAKLTFDDDDRAKSI
ncbi:methyl-accepting chemotaxis protein [Catenovulum sp. SX2]|uniref:methyl-accepting chemotaxis protein n=1 Tax=Catenovulum sp. SX2 TaxID=3398614 RepID=UPI003F85965B